MRRFIIMFDVPDDYTPTKAAQILANQLLSMYSLIIAPGSTNCVSLVGDPGTNLTWSYTDLSEYKKLYGDNPNYGNTVINFMEGHLDSLDNEESRDFADKLYKLQHATH